MKRQKEVKKTIDEAYAEAIRAAQQVSRRAEQKAIDQYNDLFNNRIYYPKKIRSADPDGYYE